MTTGHLYDHTKIELRREVRLTFAPAVWQPLHARRTSPHPFPRRHYAPNEEQHDNQRTPTVPAQHARHPPPRTHLGLLHRHLGPNARTLACFGNPDPVGMKVNYPFREETFDDDETTEEAPS
jgi:hypothetical protein